MAEKDKMTNTKWITKTAEEWIEDMQKIADKITTSSEKYVENMQKISDKIIVKIPPFQYGRGIVIGKAKSAARKDSPVFIRHNKN